MSDLNQPLSNILKVGYEQRHLSATKWLQHWMVGGPKFVSRFPKGMGLLGGSPYS